MVPFLVVMPEQYQARLDVLLSVSTDAPTDYDGSSGECSLMLDTKFYRITGLDNGPVCARIDKERNLISQH